MLLFIEFNYKIAMPFVGLEPACKLLPLLSLPRRAGILLTEPLDCFPALCLMKGVEIEPRREDSAYLWGV